MVDMECMEIIILDNRENKGRKAKQSDAIDISLLRDNLDSWFFTVRSLEH